MLKRKTVDMRLCDNRNHHIMQTEKRGNIMKKILIVRQIPPLTI